MNEEGRSLRTESDYKCSQDLDDKEAKAPQSAILGAIFCALIGGALGWLAGLGILTIQEVDSSASTSPVLGILAGVGLGGLVGFIGGWVTAMRMPDFDAEPKERVIPIEETTPERSAMLRVVDPSSAEISAPESIVTAESR